MAQSIALTIRVMLAFYGCPQPPAVPVSAPRPIATTRNPETSHRVESVSAYAAALMTNYRTSLALFAAAAVVAFIFAAITTLNRVDTRQASNGPPPGTTGLAHPHPPLEKEPGVPLRIPPSQ
jgi:hypothetical protein